MSSFLHILLFVNPTSSIRKVVVPEHGCAPCGLHSQVTLVTVSPGVQQVHVVLYQRLEDTIKFTNRFCWTSGHKSTRWQTTELTRTSGTCRVCKQYLDSGVWRKTVPDPHTVTHHFIIGPVVCHGECGLPAPLNRIQVEENCDVPKCATQI